jgi:surface protein
MFFNASVFNQNIGNWNVSNVTNMSLMFSSAISFNQNIGIWNVLKVKNMAEMFNGAKAFNQNIGIWDFTSVTDIRDILTNTGLDINTYNATLNSLASSTTLPSNLDFGGSGLVYSPLGFESHNILSVDKSMIFSGDAFISTNIILVNKPFDFIVNAERFFNEGRIFEFPFNQETGYPATQSRPITDGKIVYTNLIFTKSGNKLPCILSNANITYYLNVVA